MDTPADTQGHSWQEGGGWELRVEGVAAVSWTPFAPQSDSRQLAENTRPCQLSTSSCLGKGGYTLQGQGNKCNLFWQQPGAICIFKECNHISFWHIWGWMGYNTAGHSCSHSPPVMCQKLYSLSVIL